MATFTKLYTAKKIKKDDVVIDIVKMQKDGTKRTFFTPMKGDQHLTSTLYCRQWEAVNHAKRFLKNLESKTA